jgi:hypothetical protein
VRKACFLIKKYRKILFVRNVNDNNNICGIRPDCDRGIYQEYGLKNDTTFRQGNNGDGCLKKVSAPGHLLQ